MKSIAILDMTGVELEVWLINRAVAPGSRIQEEGDGSRRGKGVNSEWRSEAVEGGAN